MKVKQLNYIKVVLAIAHWMFFSYATASITSAHNQITPSEQSYISHVSKKYHLNRHYLTQIMTHFHLNNKIIETMKKPFEAKPYGYYRKYLISSKRIQLGRQYYKNHLKTLLSVQHHFGVPANLITAIIGIETLYGSRQGSYNELNALGTLAFYYPPRQIFFRHELTSYLQLAQREALDPLRVQGSYAGALGIPQFMPDSYNDYAISFNKKSHVNLMKNHDDAIASVANFLKHHGYKKHQPIAIKIKLPTQFPKQYINHGMPKKMLAIKKLQHYAIKIPKKAITAKFAAIIALQVKKGNEYWLVFPNFKAILGYNSSNNYALAVYELSQAIRKSYD